MALCFAPLGYHRTRCRLSLSVSYCPAGAMQGHHCVGVASINLNLFMCKVHRSAIAPLFLATKDRNQQTENLTFGIFSAAKIKHIIMRYLAVTHCCMSRLVVGIFRGESCFRCFKHDSFIKTSSISKEGKRMRSPLLNHGGSRRQVFNH